jgi:hypothetical protein
MSKLKRPRGRPRVVPVNSLTAHDDATFLIVCIETLGGLEALGDNQEDRSRYRTIYRRYMGEELPE